MKQINLRSAITCALLAALGAVFSAYLSIEIPVSGTKLVEISLAPVAVMIAGIFFGPLLGGMVGFVTDTAGFFLGVQHGAYNPVFSVTMALFGVIAGLMFFKTKEIKWPRVLITVILAQAVCSVILNSAAIHWFYGVPLQVLLWPRAISAIVEVPIYTIVMLAISYGIKRIYYQNKTGENKYGKQTGKTKKSA